MSNSTPKSGSKDSVWLRPARKPRTERPQLSQERIINTAIELLDEQGLEGLSLRRLADRLGSGVTSLYWYVNTKEDLLELAVDAILADATQFDGPSGNWRADIRELALRFREIILRHPWTASLFGQFLGIGPNALAYSESVLGVLGQTGLTGERLDGALSAIFYYVVGSAISDSVWLKTLQRAGIEGTDWDEFLKVNAEIASSNQSPIVAAYIEQFGGEDVDRRFSVGLEAILNGIEQWVERKAENG